MSYKAKWADLDVVPDLLEQLPVVALDEPAVELVVALFVALAARAPERVQLLRLLPRDPHARRVEPVLAAVATHVEPTKRQNLKATYGCNTIRDLKIKFGIAFYPF